MKRIDLSFLLRRGLPRQVWILGLVSLFMDMSSEVIHALLPVLLVSELGASMVVLGLIEGIAEAIAQIVKIFSGTISDYVQRRKSLLLLGYGMAFLTRPLFPLAHSFHLVMLGRWIDRIGKGIRGAPRDAMIADSTPPAIRGAAFGLRQSLDTLGALLGPLIALFFLWGSGGNIRFVLWLACIPAFISVAFLYWKLDEPAREHVLSKKDHLIWKFGWTNPGFWLVVLIGALLSLARFGEAFLVVRAHMAGLEISLVPLVIVVLSFFYVIASYPAGLLADRLSPHGVLSSGMAVLIVADLFLSQSHHLLGIFVGIGLWGLHMGLTQGTMAALLAGTISSRYYGTAFGIFNFISGLSALCASGLAGYLWQEMGYQWPFWVSALFALGCAMFIVIDRKMIERKPIPL